MSVKDSAVESNNRTSVKTTIPKKRKFTNNRHFRLILFVLPAFIFYLLFLFIPTIGAGVYSFTNWNALNPSFDFVGFSNYVEAFKEDSAFRHSFFFTLKYTLFVFVIQNVVALALALLIESRTRSKGFFRTIFFMPNMISLIISALMFSFIFTNVLPNYHSMPYFLCLTNPGLAMRKYHSIQF